MDKVTYFLSYELLKVNDYSISLKQAFFSLLLFTVGFIFFYLSKRIINNNKRLFQLSLHEKKKIVRLLQLLLLLITFNLVFKVLRIDIGKVLNYELLSAGKFSLSLYNALILLITIVATKVFLFVLETIFNRNAESDSYDTGKVKSVFQIIRYFVWILAIAFFLESLGFSITFLIASLSALLVGLGLGIQGFFNDIISGIVILFDRSVKVGDIVEIQGEVIGKVEDISLRTSKIITRNDVVIIVPNSSFTSENVINWSHNSRKTRFGVKVGVAYGSNVELVKSILIESCSEHNDVNSTPEPYVFFSDFGDSSLDFEVMFYTEDNFRVEKIKSDLRFTINKKFAENGVIIPFPQRDVHIYQ